MLVEPWAGWRGESCCQLLPNGFADVSRFTRSRALSLGDTADSTDADKSGGLSEDEVRTHLLTTFKSVEDMVKGNPNIDLGKIKAELEKDAVKIFKNGDKDKSGELEQKEYDDLIKGDEVQNFMTAIQSKVGDNPTNIVLSLLKRASPVDGCGQW
jgi:hypothetical protein